MKAHLDDDLEDELEPILERDDVDTVSDAIRFLKDPPAWQDAVRALEDFQEAAVEAAKWDAQERFYRYIPALVRQVHHGKVDVDELLERIQEARAEVGPPPLDVD